MKEKKERRKKNRRIDRGNTKSMMIAEGIRFSFFSLSQVIGEGEEKIAMFVCGDGIGWRSQRL